MAIEDPEQIRPARRRLVEVLLGGGLFASVVSFLYPVLKYLVPPAVPDLGQDEVVAAKVGELKPNGSKVFRFGSRPALLLLTTEDEYHAVSAVCTHLGCTVQYRSDLHGNLVRLPQWDLWPGRAKHFRPSSAAARKLFSEYSRKRNRGQPQTGCLKCSLFKHVRDWIDERFDLAKLTEPLRHKTVPIHKLSYWYFLGGITLFLFGIQVCTGILLLLYYRPSANEAFESVQYIMTRVQFGWLVRSIHSWAANLMIFTAFMHMFSVLFLRAYRKPRELTWVSGMILLFLVLGFGFSGYLLPWNTLAFFATKVGTEIPGQVPIVGHSMMVLMRGGEEVTGATLTRFFGSTLRFCRD